VALIVLAIGMLARWGKIHAVLFIVAVVVASRLRHPARQKA